VGRESRKSAHAKGRFDEDGQEARSEEAVLGCEVHSRDLSRVVAAPDRVEGERRQRRRSSSDRGSPHGVGDPARIATASSEAASSDMADEIHTARDGQSARTVLRTPEIRSARHSRAGGRAAGAAETRSCAIQRSSVTLSWSRCIERHSVRSR